ncbi:uncharacterized protein LOC143294243 isoform X1 [Babylonia areolata]|uniref:uncharacterized protein LOC143294243 isoform X1 n=1 Tax=Babylonia areolata TaxID=304850 RepID=UPI003FD5A982
MVEVQNTQHKFSCFPYCGHKDVVFTGPDGLADHRAHRLVDHRCIGNYHYTREATYDTDYLWRSPPPLPALRRHQHPSRLGPGPPGPPRTEPPIFLRPRCSFAGEVGWHERVFLGHYSDSTGHQFLTGEFRRALEDLYTHRFQNPWYPGIEEIPIPGRDGAYFKRFPNTGKPPGTWPDFRSHSVSGCPSGGASPPASSKGRPWRRAPAATPITLHSDNREVVSVESSQDGDGGVSHQGWRSSQLQSTAYPGQSVQAREGTSSSSSSDSTLTSTITSSNSSQNRSRHSSGSAGNIRTKSPHIHFS